MPRLHNLPPSILTGAWRDPSSTLTRRGVCSLRSQICGYWPPFYFLKVPNTSKDGLQDWVHGLKDLVRNGLANGLRGGGSNGRGRSWGRRRDILSHRISRVVHRANNPNTARGTDR